MVQVRGGVAEPVLLDFGMTVRLSERAPVRAPRASGADGPLRHHRRRRLARRQDEPDGLRPGARPRVWRFFLRDTGTRDEARVSPTLQDARGAARAGQARGARRAAARRDPARPHLLLAGDRAPRGRTRPRPRRTWSCCRAREARARVAPPPPLRALALAPPAVRLPHALPLHAKLACCSFLAPRAASAPASRCASSAATPRSPRRRRASAARSTRGRGRRRCLLSCRPSSPSSRCTRSPSAASPYDQTIASLWPAFGQNGKAG